MSSLDSTLDVSALVEMGFDRERVEQAIAATNKSGIPAALEWLFNHPLPVSTAGHTLGGGGADVAATGHTLSSGSNGIATDVISSVVETGSINVDAALVEGTAEVEGSGSATTSTSDTVACSLVCEDCGKQLRSHMDAEAHASRTGHQNFAESSESVKPLSPEEREEQKKRLQEKLEERKKVRQEAEKQADIEREKARRKTGREVTQAKQDHDYQEMKRLAEDRRKEKAEEKRLKQKIKDEIAKDRASMKGNASPQTTLVASSSIKPQAEVTEKPPVKKEYTECRLQLRLTDGTSLTSSFQVDDTLFTVHDYIDRHRTDGAGPFSLSTTFPRKTFNDDDMLKTLKTLQLVPSAVLVVAKR